MNGISRFHKVLRGICRFHVVTMSLPCFALLSVPASGSEPLRVVSYNVENLFHPVHDSVWIERDSVWVEKDDYEWTPEGERRWTYTRYSRKVENIARVLTNTGEWEGVDVAGLQEVENALCVKSLCYTLRRGEYDFVHYESPDRRGIDVAFIYKKESVDTLRTRAIPVTLQSAIHGGYETSRDILYVCARTKKTAVADTLHFFVCHLPSQRGGAAESAWKREQSKQVLQEAIDSVFRAEPGAKIIVMGDMNGAPQDDLKGLSNRMKRVGNKSSGAKGTHKYQGRWTCLDQFYTSPALDSISEVQIYDAEWLQEPDERYLGLKPKRTYSGFRYQNGYSDHLPIVLKVSPERRKGTGADSPKEAKTADN